MKKSQFTLVAIIILTLLLSACARMAAPAPMEYQSEPLLEGESFGGGEESRAFDAVVEEKAMAPQEFPSAENTADEAIERMVIKNAELSIVVGDPAKAMDEIASMADQMGGYVVNANLYQRTLSSGAKVDQANITIRVPAERLDEALAKIKEGAGEVLRENINSQDITSQYTDLRSRLRNLEAAEAQLQEIMEDAYKTEDVLRVYNELVSVREQIEVIKGQMQYYEQASALSSISVEITADEAIQPIEIGGWRPEGTAKEAISRLIKTLQWLGDIAIWTALCVLPVGLLIGVPLFFIVRAVVRVRRKRKAEKAAAKTDSPEE